MNFYFRLVEKINKIAFLSLLILASCISSSHLRLSSSKSTEEKLLGKYQIHSYTKGKEEIEFNGRYIVEIQASSISFNKDVNNCSTYRESILMSGDTVKGYFSCTEECCDGNFEKVASDIDLRGIYELFPNGRLRITNYNVIPNRVFYCTSLTTEE